jgi:hypothetical protein
LVFFLLTLGLAKGAARAVAGGASVPGQAASLYGFHAREVLVQWVGDANPIDFPEGGSLVLLLGRNGERLQLFDPNLQRVWEIDASDVILSTPIGE